jgi:hypothetical protein
MDVLLGDGRRALAPLAATVSRRQAGTDHFRPDRGGWRRGGSRWALARDVARPAAPVDLDSRPEWRTTCDPGRNRLCSVAVVGCETPLFPRRQRSRCPSQTVEAGPAARAAGISAAGHRRARLRHLAGRARGRLLRGPWRRDADMDRSAGPSSATAAHRPWRGPARVRRQRSGVLPAAGRQNELSLSHAG